MKLNNVLMCGGDLRSVYMAEFFKNQGLDVSLCGIDEAVAVKHGIETVSIADGLERCDAIIFGLPAVKGDMNIHAPLSADCIGFEKVLKLSKDSTVFVGGRFSKEANLVASDYGVKLIDYSCDEVFQIENAFYTAEGAVEAIIKNTERSLGELKILITGYGRISKALSKIMSSIGCHITVYARKSEQRAWAKMFGYETVDNLNSIENFDVLVNTVPHELFVKEKLCKIKKDALIIDLSARPGYVSKECCALCGVKLIFLPGLPGVTAPCSAGEAAARAVVRMCSEL